MKQYLGSYVWVHPETLDVTYIDIHYNQEDGRFESHALTVDLSTKKNHQVIRHFNTHSQYIFEMYPNMRRIDDEKERKHHD